MHRNLCLLLISGAIAIAVAQDRQPGRGPNFYSIEKEVELGRQLAGEFRHHVTPLESPATLAYVNDIGQRLAAAIGGPPFLYTFAVVSDDPTMLHEAAAFPGGYIFVPAGLILAAKNEDEFAGMLAHAVAHVASRDFTREATRGQIVDMATTPLVFMGGWTGYAIEQGASIAIPLGMLRFRRQMELAADTLAAARMSDAGYDPEALARYIERVQPAADPYATTKVYTALPDRDQRLLAIRGVIPVIPGRTFPPHPGFDRMQAEVRKLTAGAKKPPSLAK